MVGVPPNTSEDVSRLPEDVTRLGAVVSMGRGGVADWPEEMKAEKPDVLPGDVPKLPKLLLAAAAPVVVVVVEVVRLNRSESKGCVRVES